eukprot:COSAG02_NODE_262_length_26647_cov_21.607240_17_plen_38_part_00
MQLLATDADDEVDLGAAAATPATEIGCSDGRVLAGHC